MIAVSKAAAELDVSTETIRRWIKDGTLRGTKIGSRWKVYEDSLHELIENGEPEPGVIDPHASRSRLVAVQGSLRERSAAA